MFTREEILENLKIQDNKVAAAGLKHLNKTLAAEGDGHRFNISREWDTMDPEAAGFQEKLVDALVSGVWIADLWITEEFDTPKFQGIYRATGAAFMKV